MAEDSDRLATNGRPPDQEFAPKEQLYRRFMPEYTELEVDVIELPDISCIRQKYGKPEDALRSSTNKFDEWGVMQFEVKDIPRSLNSATKIYDFKPVHVPYETLYPHTEVQAFEGTIHIDKNLIVQMDGDVQLRFREKLLRWTTIRIRSGEGRQ